jgi:DNA repair protein RecO (recombination protein O)
MGLVNSEAMVLRTYDLAEADKIAVCFTRSAGVVRGVAHGARRLKNRFGAGLEPFTQLQLSYFEKEGRELVTLRNLEITHSYFKLSCHVEVVKGMAYMSELVMAFSPPHEPNEKMYRMIRACLAVIEETPDALPWVLRYFEGWMLRLTGFFSITQNCASCNARFGENSVVYLDSELQQVCDQCGRRKGTTISVLARKQLIGMQRQPPAVFAEHAQQLSPKAQQELARLMRKVIAFVLEREPGR